MRWSTGRAVAVLVAVASLLVAVPAVLWTAAGNPLPSRLPGLGEIGRALSAGDVRPATVLKILAAVCWLAWAQLVAALVIEAMAAARDRPAPDVAALVIGQTLAAAAVGALAVLVGHRVDPGPGGSARPLAELLGADTGTPVARADAEPESTSSDDPAGADQPQEAAALETSGSIESMAVPGPLPEHTVRPRETLWSIAETRLGDGLRWREIFELNQGRPQVVGGQMERADAPLREGWVLDLPSDAQPPPHDSDRAEAGAAPGAPIRELDAPAAARLHEAVEAARQSAEEADREHRDALDALGPTRRGSPLDDPLPDVDGDEVDRDEVDLERSEEIAEVEDLPHRPGTLSSALVGAGVLTAGLVWTLDQARRRTERRRRAGAPAASAADGEQLQVELALRASAQPDRAASIDAVLRAWSSGLRAAGRTPPPVVGVNVADEISLLFGVADHEPLEGFTVEDDGYSWVAPADLELGLEPDRPRGGEPEPPPLPALYTLGHTDHSQVLLNAEAADVVSVVGAGELVAETLTTIALELATGPWAGSVRIVIVGFGHDLGIFERVTTVETVGEALRLLTAGDHATGTRVGDTPDAAMPTVVVCAGQIDPGELRQLLELAGGNERRRITVLAGGDVAGASWRIEVRQEEVSLHPVDITLRRHRISAEARMALARLFTTTREADDAEVITLRPGATPPLAPTAGVTGPPADPAVPPVEVRVLGPVDVVGASAPFPRRKALEFAAYLATHPRGVEADTIANALWPDRLVSQRTLHTTASMARGTLGSDEHGHPRLARATTDGLYRLGAEVGLDWARFGDLVARAGELEGEARISRLRAALDLVRGRPFTVPGGEFLWAHAEALASAAVADVADAAHRLACLYVEEGDVRGAWWATQQGLLASPGNEQLHRDRMRAADAAGNPDGVEEVMDELCRAVEIEPGELHDVLHPKTIEVYERLSRRRAGRTLLSRA